MVNWKFYQNEKLKKLGREYFSLIGMILVIIIFSIFTKGKLLSGRNLMNIFNNFFSIGLGTMGILFLMSLGELDLSIGAILGLSATLAAMAAKIDLALIFPVALLTGILIGSINGFVIAYLKVESFIGTLALSFVTRGMTVWLLNGSVGIPLSQRVFDKSYVKIIAFIVIALGTFMLFEYMPFGKKCRSIGAAEEAARQSGISVERVRMLSFLISGFLCGLAGFFSLVRTCTASSKTGNGFEFDVLLAILFGGIPLTGGWAVRFRSALVGSIAMAVVYNGMSLMGIDGLTQQIIQGIILIVVVIISFDRRNTAIIK